MPSRDTSDRPGLVVLGAAGRVGSAVVTTLLRRGHDLTAVVHGTAPDQAGLGDTDPAGWERSPAVKSRNR